MLFCDLVGFTPFSEKRDPEEVREVLSGYFELARAIVGRYGGIVEKFIGDAVMAVWGAPVAKEDDAERAVRAGLELVSAVAAYGTEHQTDLQARVGIVTGGAATTETAEEGLVIGDRVNTAARIQSAAPPGCCYVDEMTRAATAAAIAYVDAGEHELKGKAEPVRLFQATRVVAAVAGSQRSGVLEAPFIGRDHELRLVKELFHASAERHSARLVLVSGVAGVGKSRLAWEFFKYIDGLAGTVLWHAGRCLSYGEGVSYWALSEMVRARLQISEEDPQEVVAERLRTGLERWIADAADREFIAPRLGQLLGTADPEGARERGALLGLAPVLRTPGRAPAGRHGHRGPAVGRRRHGRLPGPPPRVVGRPRHLPPRAVATGGDRAQGPRALPPERHDPPARPALRRGHRRAPGRPRHRPARRRTGTHRGAGRGDPALRDRDGAGPARQGRPREGRRRRSCTSSASSASSRSRPG